MLFPLGKTGGLIEAVLPPGGISAPYPGFRWVKPAASLKRVRAGRVDRRICGLFPLGKTGGLIEARRAARRVPTSTDVFPLGKTGGLIEALDRDLQAGEAFYGFRWVKPAASLKHGHPADDLSTPEGSFRWVKPAASLKQRHEVELHEALLLFPLGKTGGLIEAPRHRRQNEVEGQVSAG